MKFPIGFLACWATVPRSEAAAAFLDIGLVGSGAVIVAAKESVAHGWFVFHINPHRHSNLFIGVTLSLYVDIRSTIRLDDG